jgi:high-affinity K+ transport system ATPase subunit B
MAKSRDIALFDRAIVRQAIGAAFRKLDPRTLIRNPVMFVVEVTAILATFVLVRDIVKGGEDNLLVVAQIAAWLWFSSPTSRKPSPKGAARRARTRCGRCTRRRRPSASRLKARGGSTSCRAAP